LFLKRINYSINKRLGKYFNFLKAISYINKNKVLNDIILKNRLLVKHSKYLNYDDYNPGDYGVNPTIARDMHLNQSKLPTYSDLICYMTSEIWNNQLNYLEIGTSLMKNVHQVNNQINNSSILCIDIETPPIIFDEVKNNRNNNSVDYLTTDIFDTEKINEYFKKRKNLNFDFIFSDAAHTYEGLLQEYNSIYKNKLNKKFIIYFDDLDFPRLEDAFIEIYKDLESNRSEMYSFTFDINGWVGINEKSHKNGIITNFDLPSLLKNNNIYLKNYKKT
jgi:hypothetical protein